jgi:hypothetical protein
MVETTSTKSKTMKTKTTTIANKTNETIVAATKTPVICIE